MNKLCTYNFRELNLMMEQQCLNANAIRYNIQVQIELLVYSIKMNA